MREYTTVLIVFILILVQICYSSSVPSTLVFVGVYDDSEFAYYNVEISLSNGKIHNKQQVDISEIELSNFVSVLNYSPNDGYLMVTEVEGSSRNQYYLELGNIDSKGTYTSDTDNIKYQVFNPPLAPYIGYDNLTETLLFVAADYQDQAFLYFYNFKTLTLTPLNLKIDAIYPYIPAGVYDVETQSYYILYVEEKSSDIELVTYDLSQKSLGPAQTIKGIESLNALNSTYLIVTNKELYLLDLNNANDQLVFYSIDQNSGTANPLYSTTNYQTNSTIISQNYYTTPGSDYIVFFTFPSPTNQDTVSIITFEISTATVVSTSKVTNFPYLNTDSPSWLF
ncbi:hypothetical protein DLAC_05955 [Tieghemostelium lacteum]|uniref:Uncharacterized protein n=1 Tax=Tieghemostelium lacteum TaxID=361077 RepID=A0A151ZH40_TIELA|nr:hypothetical protein DLAC_05955 [Tieghemostelium lacteum]|eukprot:KYQ93292.1 hypothetical protein DLAC_05955 [Tieghemostelium lacteum]